MAFAAPVMAGMSLAGSIAGGLLQAQGAEQQAQASSAMYNYRASIAATNAALAKRNAQIEFGVGEEKALESGLAGRQRIGAIRAAQGASGVQVDSGSAADVVAGQRVAERMDEGIIRENAGRKSYDYTIAAVGDTQQASLDTMAGENSLEAGDIAATGSLIGTATSVADKWAQFSKLGVL